MTDLHALLFEIDELTQDDLETVYRHIVQRRQPSYWLIPGEKLAAIRDIMRPVYEQNESLSEAEINTAINEALIRVRRER